MNRNSITSFAEYSDLISGYKTDRSLSNNYMMREEVERHIAASDMSFSATDHNLFLFVRKPKCMRMYYYLNDFDELYVPDENVVIEILFRGNQCFPTVENDYFRHCGYQENLIRDLYAGTFSDMNISMSGRRDLNIGFANNIGQIELASEMFNSVFDPYSGDYISANEYETLLGGKHMMVAYDSDGNFTGALHQTRKGTAVWISHIAVAERFRGRQIGQALLDTWIAVNHNDGYDRYMLWVQRQNAAAVSMYRKTGFRYLNKSTISLLYLK